jgi:hypothetical protein
MLSIYALPGQWLAINNMFIHGQPSVFIDVGCAYLTCSNSLRVPCASAYGKPVEGWSGKGDTCVFPSEHNCFLGSCWLSVLSIWSSFLFRLLLCPRHSLVLILLLMAPVLWVTAPLLNTLVDGGTTLLFMRHNTASIVFSQNNESLTNFIDSPAITYLHNFIRCLNKALGDITTESRPAKNSNMHKTRLIINQLHIILFWPQMQKRLNFE